MASADAGWQDAAPHSSRIQLQDATRESAAPVAPPAHANSTLDAQEPVADAARVLAARRSAGSLPLSDCGLSPTAPHCSASPPTSPSLPGLQRRNRSTSITTTVRVSTFPVSSPDDETRSRSNTIETETIDHRHDERAEYINSYCLLDELGRGAFGLVRRAELGGQLFAVKCISKKRLKREGFRSRAPGDSNADGLASLRSEIASLKKIDHPHIVKLIEVMNDPAHDTVFMVFEFVPKGAIMVLDAGHSPFSELQACNFFRQLLLAVEFLHHHHIVHRDIKPANLLLVSDHQLKLSDFGVAHIFDEEDKLTQMAGTPAFLAPEVDAGLPFEGRPVDVWAMGITLYCFLFAELPFASKSLLELRQSTRTAEPSFAEVPQFTVSLAAMCFVKKLVVKSPRERATLEQLRTDPWLYPRELPPLVSEAENLCDMDAITVTEAEVASSLVTITLVGRKVPYGRKRRTNPLDAEPGSPVDEQQLQMEAIYRPASTERLPFAIPTLTPTAGVTQTRPLSMTSMAMLSPSRRVTSEQPSPLRNNFSFDFQAAEAFPQVQDAPRGSPLSPNRGVAPSDTNSRKRSGSLRAPALADLPSSAV
eukprot:m.98522 g.98522  ORF g.98522 m.98522 type:complete len:592 (+) comp51408_c0_seq3:61-1836(+)